MPFTSSSIIGRMLIITLSELKTLSTYNKYQGYKKKIFPIFEIILFFFKLKNIYVYKG